MPWWPDRTEKEAAQSEHDPERQDRTKPGRSRTGVQLAKGRHEWDDEGGETRKRADRGDAIRESSHPRLRERDDDADEDRVANQGGSGRVKGECRRLPQPGFVEMRVRSIRSATC